MGIETFKDQMLGAVSWFIMGMDMGMDGMGGEGHVIR